MKTIAAILAAAMISTAAAQDRAHVTRRLEAVKVTLDFQNAPLSSVLEYLRDAAGLDFVLHHALAADTRVTLRLKDVSLRTALKLALRGCDASAVERDGVIVIGPREAVAPALRTRLHDIRDLTFVLRDFEGPTMEFGAAPGIRVDWDMGGPEPVHHKEFLHDLVWASTGGVWENGASITEISGWLVVTQTARVQEEIAALLNRMRTIR